MSYSSLPGTFGKPRIVTLVASLLVALSAGTNYVFSAYGPQLGARLQISHTKLNLIGLGGNVGVHLSGPFWGRIVDKHGPRYPLLSAFLLLLIGYSGIRVIYDGGLPESSKSLPAIWFGLLIMFSFMTGVGGNGGFAGAINSTAKTFPDAVRGSTTGLVISGFGLSAFAFSTTAHLAFPGDTSSFLLTLTLGTSFPMILGFFFLRPIPLPSSGTYQGYEEVDFSEAEAASLVPSVFQHENNSQIVLLNHDEELAAGCDQDPSTPPEEYIPDAGIAVELSPTRSTTSHAHRSRSRTHARGGRSISRSKPLIGHGPNIFGKNLWTSLDFWVLFVSLSLASGTGLMYINNVGSMSQALYIHSSPSTYNEVEASQWQATQVSTISFMNFLGRILIGLLSDFAKAQFGLPRSYLLILVSGIVLSSQLAASHIDEVTNLWKSSALLGLGYGSVFSLYAAICIEWFGLPHFSENWGYLSLSPLFGGNIFSVAFGRNLDAHESPVAIPSITTVSELPARQCLEGRVCYVDSLYLTTGACLLSMLLSAWAAWRDRRRSTVLEEDRTIRRPEVIWEEPDA